MPSVRADPAVGQTFHQPSETISECEALSAGLLYEIAGANRHPGEAVGGVEEN